MGIQRQNGMIDGGEIAQLTAARRGTQVDGVGENKLVTAMNLMNQPQEASRVALLMEQEARNLGDMSYPSVPAKTGPANSGPSNSGRGGRNG